MRKNNSQCLIFLNKRWSKKKKKRTIIIIIITKNNNLKYLSMNFIVNNIRLLWGCDKQISRLILKCDEGLIKTLKNKYKIT